MTTLAATAAPSPGQDVTIRPGRDGDADGFIALIGACWGEYPGCVLDVDAELPELRALATHYAGRDGALWAAQDNGGPQPVVGMVAVSPLDAAGGWEIGRMYVQRTHRGTGLAHRLIDAAERHATTQGARRLVLWSDTRFEAAHQFYEKRGYLRSGPIRVLDDLSRSLEFRYAKPLGPVAVAVLDAAAATGAERCLAGILVACVDAGASVSYLPPLAVDVARGFWRRVSSRVATGDCVLLAAWSDGVLAGTVQLDIGTPANGRHRAAVQKLLVHPDYRRRGIAHALMHGVEQAARQAGRTLLELDTRQGGPAEALYGGLGWTKLGVIPGYTRDAAGRAHATTLFYKQL